MKNPIKKSEIRIEKYRTPLGIMSTKLRLMASAEGYVMVRCKGCMPTIMSIKKWEKLEVAVD